VNGSGRFFLTRITASLSGLMRRRAIRIMHACMHAQDEYRVFEFTEGLPEITRAHFGYCLLLHPIQRSLSPLLHCCFIESLPRMVYVLLIASLLFLSSVMAYRDHWNDSLVSSIHPSWVESGLEPGGRLALCLSSVHAYRNPVLSERRFPGTASGKRT
jgi:hypothetical protein